MSGFKAANGVIDLGEQSSEDYVAATLMYLYAEYNPNWIYYGWHLYLAPVENGIPNRHSPERLWLGLYDWMLDKVLKVLGIEVMPGDGYSERTKRFMKAYPAGVLVWSGRNNRAFEVATDCGVEVWECFRAVRADREKDWYNDDDHAAKWRDLFKCANAEKRKRRRERNRALGMVTDAVTAQQKKRRWDTEKKKVEMDVQALLPYVQHKLGCHKMSNYLQACTCGAAEAIETARKNGWVKDERNVLTGI